MECGGLQAKKQKQKLVNKNWITFNWITGYNWITTSIKGLLILFT